MANPTIMGNATGSHLPNPRYYGFDWPELQRTLEIGQSLFDRRNELGHEQQDLLAEKKRLEADLVKAQAGVTLAAVGLADSEIGNAGFAVDGPKAEKRLRAIEKRLTELDRQRSGLELAVQQHKGDLEHVVMTARQEGKVTQDIEEANAGDLAEAQRLEAQLTAIHERIRGREQLDSLFGASARGYVA